MTSAPPRVSILTLTYNHSAYLAQCVRSLQGQTVSDWEQIIVDDGSTDATADVASSFKDPRVRYFRREHVGVLRLAESYNFGLAQARAPLIGIVEGDDYWDSRLLENQLPLFADPETVLAFAEIGAVVDGAPREAAHPIRHWTPQAQANNPIGSALGPLLAFEGMPQPMTWILRRTALDAIGGFQQTPGLPTTDYPTILRLALRGRFAYTDKVLAYWRKHAAQTTNQLAGALFVGNADLAEHFFDHEIPAEILPRLGFLPVELRRKIQTQRAFGHFRQGRRELLSARWTPARESFQRAWRGGTSYVRAASLAGWSASWLRANLEPFARLLGKEWYKSGPRKP